MMKKIGICACYNSQNYGSMLQAYATQIAIESLGYDSEFIVYKKRKTIFFIVRQIPRLLNKNLMFDKILVMQKKIDLRKHPDIMKSEQVRQRAFKRFQKKYKHLSPEYYGYKALCGCARNYSSVLVGSDQLWTPGGLATNFYNLMFVSDDINKVSYATSFGVSKIPWYQIKRTKKYLNRINHLSVRELNGAEIIQKITGLKANVVLDPTLLLTREDWESEIPKKEIIKEPYIFCYFLGENSNHREIAEEFSRQIGLKIVCTPFLDSFVERDIKFGDYKLFDVGPDDFVNLIRGAEFVLTDSFHGTVFSIIHNKKFIVLNRYMNTLQSRNSRIDSLCSLLSLEERRYSNNNNIYVQMLKEINYDKVSIELELLRNKSIEYLKNSLEE